MVRDETVKVYNLYSSFSGRFWTPASAFVTNSFSDKVAKGIRLVSISVLLIEMSMVGSNQLKQQNGSRIWSNCRLGSYSVDAGFAGDASKLKMFAPNAPNAKKETNWWMKRRINVEGFDVRESRSERTVCVSSEALNYIRCVLHLYYVDLFLYSPNRME